MMTLKKTIIQLDCHVYKKKWISKNKVVSSALDSMNRGLPLSSMLWLPVQQLSLCQCCICSWILSSTSCIFLSCRWDWHGEVEVNPIQQGEGWCLGLEFAHIQINTFVFVCTYLVKFHCTFQNAAKEPNSSHCQTWFDLISCESCLAYQYYWQHFLAVNAKSKSIYESILHPKAAPERLKPTSAV